MILRWTAILICSILTGGPVADAQSGPPAIRLERSGNVPQLMIGNQPFLILGGELGNSSASSMDYLRPLWDRFRQMHLNTLVAPVYWELLEPEENRFDFALVDSLIGEASRHELKLVLLWFGTWKNSMSCYAPLWMKTDPRRFPRTADSAGRSQELFSVFGKETLDADKKAFATLMRHVREVDGKKQTVIMVQVENEIGMIPTAREVSAVANARYGARVPAGLTARLKNGGKTEGSWEEVFGKGVATEEIFQAWFYARYANEVALAGKKEYDLPMYVNAALPRPGSLPGKYPSGGPLPHLMDVWQAAAPGIDLLSPDFYNPDTRYWCDLYVKNRNPLFIPEMRFEPSVAAKVFLVIGHYKALGFSPFSIESESTASLPLGRSYDLLQQLSPVITGRKWLAMEGFVLDGGKTSTVTMGHYTIRLAHYKTLPWAGGGKDSLWGLTGGMIIQTGEDEFLVAGTGFVASFSHTDPARVSNIASCDEVKYVDGREVLGRRMNGDQDHQGRHVRFATEEWGIQKVRLYNSPARIE